MKLRLFNVEKRLEHLRFPEEGLRKRLVALKLRLFNVDMRLVAVKIGFFYRGIEARDCEPEACNRNTDAVDLVRLVTGLT